MKGTISLSILLLLSCSTIITMQIPNKNEEPVITNIEYSLKTLGVHEHGEHIPKSTDEYEYYHNFLIFFYRNQHNNPIGALTYKARYLEPGEICPYAPKFGAPGVCTSDEYDMQVTSIDAEEINKEYDVFWNYKTNEIEKNY